ncbi:hypothetical protein PsorP6_007520 [Peronosclerospora sorghi]|uniref:Uncharacterized protein n=1 Tax=Peronosclerospora sorghi TaxID=230839 RepID=A0ACC0WBG1_9STRA|nr:hypothetical protein PsorP6_007520 [Peronosclerospora sorghi]
MDAHYGGRDNVEPSATLEVGGIGGVKVVERGDKEPKSFEIVGAEEEPKLWESPTAADLVKWAQTGSGGNLSDDLDDRCKSPTPDPLLPPLEDAIASTRPAKSKRNADGDATPQDKKVRTGGKDKEPIILERIFAKRDETWIKLLANKETSDREARDLQLHLGQKKISAELKKAKTKAGVQMALLGKTTEEIREFLFMVE